MFARMKFRLLWLGSVRQWHWISSAICLIGMLLFSVTGITLNHAAQIRVEPEITTIETPLPDEILQLLSGAGDIDKAPLPEPVGKWLRSTQGIPVFGQEAEWSEDEIYISLPRPGGDAWMTIDLVSGDLFYEKTDRGWVSYFNDLHKGRNTGIVWFWFIDVFAVACIIFCITGLILLQRHAGNRPTTWPMVGLGLVIPLILIVLFIH